MQLATWNVNSAKARHERMLAWLGRLEPDVVCLQELKGETDAFSRIEYEALGYDCAVYGQKTYNGVAILSRTELSEVRVGFDDDVDDPQARFIAATTQGVRILCAYVPNGGEVGGPRYPYKLQWLKRLRDYLNTHESPDTPTILCGDFNVAPFDDDVAPEWQDSVLTHPDVRVALENVRQWGFEDVVRAKHPAGGLFSWWDYRQLGFAKNKGARIDHIYATRSMAERCTEARVDRDERKGKKPSDHAPVLATFSMD